MCPDGTVRQRGALGSTWSVAEAQDVLGDLHPTIGGVGRWDGPVDFKQRVVLSECLLDAALGALTHA